MLLSVMMLGLESRPWLGMYDQLEQQRESLCLSDQQLVEILIDIDNGESTSGIKRQRITDRSQGKYICFVDDDDRLSPHYLTSLIEQCKKGPDVVTFKLQMEWLGSAADKRRPEIWEFGLWRNRRHRGQMSANHLCAWRKDLARKVAWCPNLGYGDDQLWYQPLIMSGLVESVKHIPEILYYYQFSFETTENQKRERIEAAKHYVRNGLGCFKWNKYPESIFIEIHTKDNPDPNKYTCVRDCHNKTHLVNSSELKRFHTIKIA